MGSDWREWIDKYPYEGIDDPKYIKDRDNFFKGNNGWWWGDGWWNGHTETPMEIQRKYRQMKEEQNVNANKL
jgi:hypothetical protein